MAYSTYMFDYSQMQVTAGYPAYPDGSYHRGIDIKTPNNAYRNLGSPVSGEVIRSEYGTGGNWSWGNFICVYDASRDITVLMAHFAERLVSVGATVNAGDIIGVYGSTGNVTGPHCHVEQHAGRGITNVLQDPSGIIGVPNAIGTYDIEYAGGETPSTPPGSLTQNILLVVFNYNGHTINAPASNDEKYIYFNNEHFYRFPMDDYDKVQQYGSWKYWQDITNVNILAVFNKDLGSLPDV